MLERVPCGLEGAWASYKKCVKHMKAILDSNAPGNF